MPVAHLDMEGKYVRALLAYEEAHKLAMEEEIKVAKIVSAIEEKQQAVRQFGIKNCKCMKLLEHSYSKG